GGGSRREAAGRKESGSILVRGASGCHRRHGRETGCPRAGVQVAVVPSKDFWRSLYRSGFVGSRRHSLGCVSRQSIFRGRRESDKPTKPTIPTRSHLLGLGWWQWGACFTPGRRRIRPGRRGGTASHRGRGF